MKKHENHDIAHRLKHLRLLKGYTQSQLAADTGIPRASIATWESGSRTPQLRTIKKLAEYYGVSYEYMAGFYDEDSLEIDLSQLNETGQKLLLGYYSELISSEKYTAKN